MVGHRGPHGRNPSYGKNLNKLNRLASNTHIHHETRNHQRKRSGPVAANEAVSPKTTNIQRNTSQASLPRATSHASIKKNHSATSILRNTSEGKLKKLGLAPLTPAKQKEKENSVGGFQLGDNSSSEEEAEWEDSSASPNTTRKNSTVELAKGGQDVTITQKHQPSPGSSLKHQHKSAASLARKQSTTPNQPPEDAPTLLRDARSARAPPAMSSVAAFARLPSNSNVRGNAHAQTNDQSGLTPATSSIENGVSRFVNGSMGAESTPRTPDLESDEDDDYDLPSSFLPHYHPQAPPGSPHPTTSRSSSSQINRRPNGSTLPSRTQQRLELQRRETMRSSAATPENDPVQGPLALRARSASRGRSRGGQDTAKVAKKDYDSVKAQLEVIKRYRNPMVEALHRLQDLEILPKVEDKNAAGGKSRPVSRAGSRRHSLAKSTTGNVAYHTVGDGLETNGHDRVPSRGRVRFERQGSHEDIGLSRSDGQEAEDAELDGIENSIHAEEALIRRMWESRAVYETA